MYYPLRMVMGYAKEEPETVRELFRVLHNEKLPFTQTEFLVQEAILLKQEIREGKIKLKEPRSFTKDRIVALGYGNMFFNKLENKLSKEDQVNDFDEEAWKNIIQV